VTTSAVADPTAGWARTLNPVYRLDREAKPQHGLDELIATWPSVTPDYDLEAVMRASEEDPDLPPWRP
jgi:hypothetical protein